MADLAGLVATAVESEGRLTKGQEITLSLLTMFSASLSIVGSSLIVFRMLRVEVTSSSYQRIMLGLSCADLIGSIMHVMKPFLVPKDSPNPSVWAIGNHATCCFLGFLSQLGILVVAYNGILGYYYLFTIRFGIKKDVFAKKFEFWMHFTALFFFILTALLGLLVGYGEVDFGLGCWIQCAETDSEQVCRNTKYIQWGFGGLPLLFVFVSLPVAHLAVIFYVWKELKNRKSSTISPELPSAIDNPARHVRGAELSPNRDECSIQFDRAKESAKQGSFYVATFFLSYTALFVVRVLDMRGIGTEEDLFPLLLISAFFTPLQGFFILIVYIRPNFKRARAVFPAESTFWLIKQCIFDQDVPRITPPSARLNVKSTVNMSTTSASMPQILQSGTLDHSSRTVSTNGRRRSTLTEILETDEKLPESILDDDEEEKLTLSNARRRSYNQAYPAITVAAADVGVLDDNLSRSVPRESGQPATEAPSSDFDDDFYVMLRSKIRRIDMDGGFWDNVNHDNADDVSNVPR